MRGERGQVREPARLGTRPGERREGGESGMKERGDREKGKKGKGREERWTRKEKRIKGKKEYGK